MTKAADIFELQILLDDARSSLQAAVVDLNNSRTALTQDQAEIQALLDSAFLPGVLFIDQIALLGIVLITTFMDSVSAIGYAGFFQNGTTGISGFNDGTPIFSGTDDVAATLFNVIAVLIGHYFPRQVSGSAAGSSIASTMTGLYAPLYQTVTVDLPDDIIHNTDQITTRTSLVQALQDAIAALQALP